MAGVGDRYPLRVELLHPTNAGNPKPWVDAPDYVPRQPVRTPSLVKAPHLPCKGTRPPL